MTEAEWERMLDGFGRETICAYRGDGATCCVCQMFTEGPLARRHAPGCPVRHIAAKVVSPMPPTHREITPGLPAIPPMDWR